LGSGIASRRAFAAVRTIFALVEYLVHPRRVFVAATQRPFLRWPATRRWKRSVTDPRPEIVNTIRPRESFGFDTVGTAGVGVGAGVVPGGAGWLRKNAYIAAVSSGPDGSA
jgi:hypothetical protein